MNTFKQFIFFIATVTVITSCGSGNDVQQLLSNTQTRKAIIDSIADNRELSQQMMTAMMNSKDSTMMMNHNGAMMEMMQTNPAIMQMMLSNMMERSRTDSSMMSGICNTIIGNQQMMDMIQKKMMEKQGNSNMQKKMH